MINKHITRFYTETGIDICIDWCQVVALQKQNFQINIHLITGVCLQVMANNYDNVDNYFNLLYDQWNQCKGL